MAGETEGTTSVVYFFLSVLHVSCIVTLLTTLDSEATTEMFNCFFVVWRAFEFCY